MKSLFPRVLLAIAVLVCLVAAIHKLAHRHAGGPERPHATGPSTSVSTGAGTVGPAPTPASSSEDPAAHAATRAAPPVDPGTLVHLDGFVHTSDGHPAAAAVEAESFLTPPPAPASTKCGEDGKFSMDLPAGTWSVRASSPGMLSAPAIATLKVGATTHLDLVLLTAAAITGTVTGPDNEPLRDAEVAAKYSTSDEENGGAAKAYVDKACTTKTEEHGHYRLVVLPGTHYLQADKEGFAPAMAKVVVPTGGEGTCDLQLVQGLKISGRVTDKEGAPLEGVTLTASWYSPLKDGSGGSYARTAKSGADGRYVVAGLREGGHSVNATSDAYLADHKEEVAAGSENVDFALVKGGRIEGKVVRKSDGAPVPSPSVSCSQGSLMMGSRNGVKADPGGTFVVQGLAPGKHVIDASAKGYAPGHSAEIEVAAGQVITGVVIELTAGGTLRATVLSAAARAPIQGASVSRLQKVGMMEADADTMAGTTPERTQSDAEGRLVWEHLPPGQWRFRVSHEEHASVTKTIEIVEEQEAREEFDLPDGGRIIGKVESAGGAPRKGASVTCMSTSYSEPKAAVTDDLGKYELKGLAEGSYMVMMYESLADAGTPKMNMRTVQVKDGQSVEVDFLSKEGVRLFGTVRQGGRAKGDLMMQLFSTSGGGSMASCKTDVSGNYEVKGLRAGQYSVVVGEVMMKCVVPDGQADVRQDFDLPTGVVSGHVYDKATGAKLQGAEVSACRTTGGAKGGMSELLDRMASSTTTDAEGAYTLSGLSAGEYVLQVSKEGYAVEIGEPLSIEAEGNIGGKDFLLSEGAEIDVVVVDAHHRPVAGATFSLRDPKSGTPLLMNSMWGKQSDEQGKCKLSGVRVGEYLLAAHAPGYASAQRVVTVAAGQNSAIEMTLTGAGTLRLRVRDSSGAPVGGASLTLIDASGNAVEMPLGMEELFDPSHSKTGADGRLERGGLAQGHYRGEVTEGARTGAFEVDVTEGQTAEADVTLGEKK